MTTFYFNSTANGVGSNPQPGTYLTANTALISVPNIATGVSDIDYLSLSETPVQAAKTLTYTVSATTFKAYYFGRFWSAPLAAQTITAQTWQVQPDCGESNGAANTYHYPALFVYRPSTSSIVGAIWNGSTTNVQIPGSDPTLEWYGSSQGNVNNDWVGAEVTCQNGDVLIYEFWAGGTPSMSSAYAQTVTIDSNTNNGSFMSCVQTLNFYTGPPVENISVDKLTETQTFRDVNVKADVKELIPRLQEVQTFRDVGVSVAQKELVPRLQETQTFLAVNINAKVKELVPRLQEVQTFRDVTVNAREIVPVPRLQEVQTLRDVNVVEKQSIPKLTQTQTLQLPTLNVKEAIAVPKIAQVQTFIVPSVVAAGGSTTTEYLNPVASAGDAGGTVWVNLGDIYSSDDFYATATLAASAQSEGVFVWAFSGLSIPADATIQGFQVEVEGAVVSGSLASFEMKLANANTYVPLSVDTKSVTFTGTDSYQVMGSASDLWGEVDTDGGGVKDRAWTPADLNTSDFGVFFRATATSSGAFVRLDHIRLKVTYSVGLVTDVVIVPTLTQIQTFPAVNISAKEVIAVPRLIEVQTLLAVNINARDVVAVPRLAQVESLYAPIVNAREIVPVTKLTETQTLLVPNINEGQTAPIFTYIQTLYAPIVNARDVVQIPRLIETQTFQAVNVNAREIVPVTKLTETQTLFAPNINVHERIVVPKITVIQTFLDLNISAKDIVAVPKLTQVQTLRLPKINEVLVIPTKAFIQTLRAPYIKETEYPPQLAFTQTLYAPETLEENQITPDVELIFTQTLLDVNVNARDVVPVPRLIQTQTFNTVRVIDVLRVDTLTQVQTFRAVNISAKDVVAIPRLIQTQTFNSVGINAAGAEAIPKLTLVQTFRDVTVNARDRILVPKLTETQTLHVPNVSVLSLIAVPKITSIQVLYAPGVNAREGLAVAVKAFVETLYAPDLNEGERILVPTLTQTQTFYDVKLSAVVQVTTKSFVETLYVPNISQPATVPISTRNFIMTMYAPSLMAIEIIEIVVSGTTEIQVTVLAEKQLDIAVLSNPMKGIVV